MGGLPIPDEAFGLFLLMIPKPSFGPLLEDGFKDKVKVKRLVDTLVDNRTSQGFHSISFSIFNQAITFQEDLGRNSVNLRIPLHPNHP